MQVQGTPVPSGQASKQEAEVITLPFAADPGTSGNVAAPGDGSAVRLYRVAEAVQLLGLSRSEIYRLFRSGRLRSVHQGRARLIPADAIAEYVALLKWEAGQ